VGNGQAGVSLGGTAALGYALMPTRSRMSRERLNAFRKRTAVVVGQGWRDRGDRRRKATGFSEQSRAGAAGHGARAVGFGGLRRRGARHCRSLCVHQSCCYTVSQGGTRWSLRSTP